MILTKNSLLLTLTIFLTWLPIAYPENQQAARTINSNQQSAKGRVRSVGILPVTDTSSLGLSQSLNTLQISLFQQAQNFRPVQVNYSLSGYSETDVKKAFQTTNTELLSMVYLEAQRITMFLFDSTRPKEFIVGSQTLIDPMLGNQVTPQVVEHRARLLFNEVLTSLYKGQFQPLPSVKADPMASAKPPDDPKQRALESKRLFRELAAMDTGKYYLGAGIGMARYSGGPGSSSNVDFGAFAGLVANERMKVELGMDFFSYALIHMDGKYKIPLEDKYVSINLSLGAGMIIGVISGPRFANEASLKNGQIAFGPGVSFDIPMLGASVRGELKLYFGGGSILMGSYGFSYSI